MQNKRVKKEKKSEKIVLREGRERQREREREREKERERGWEKERERGDLEEAFM